MSISEAFCIALLEAVSMELFVISTNIGGITEILPEEHVVFCNPNSEEIINKLCKVIDNKEYVVRNKGRRVIVESYDWLLVA